VTARRIRQIEAKDAAEANATLSRSKRLRSFVEKLTPRALRTPSLLSFAEDAAGLPWPLRRHAESEPAGEC